MNTKQIVAQLAQQFGYEIVPAWRMRGLSFARHLIALFDQYRVEAVIDVGANAGQYHDFLRTEVGFSGPVLSYEPQPDCFRKLSDRAGADGAWQIRNLALGIEAGELSLNIMQESQFSSFLAPDHATVGDFSGMNCVREVVKVPVVRLDDELSTATTPALATKRLYLKLDTQGFDLTVLRGATQTLSRVVALQTELSMKPVYQGMPGYRQMIEELEGMGFELSSMFPVSHDEDMGLIEADGVFINRRALVNSTGHA
ncbi:MAG: methyltransferase FkbM family protein [Rhodocyclales bacterium]|nr:methyltransferase FkbM family protein [Rhodocyclales bacterium]